MPKTKNKKEGVEQIVAKAFAHPLRVQILIILNEKVASPNMLANQLDQSLNLVAYHVRVLEKYDCIELVDTKQRRGATEHFYRATRRQFLTDSEWSRLPESLRPGLSGAMLKSAFEDVEEALDKGTFDELEDRHLSRTPMVVDQKGWEDAAELLAGTLDRLLEVQAEASERLAASGEAGMLSKVVMLHFKSPNPQDSKDGEGKEQPTAEAEPAS
ncbi:MAG TPA: winged helix-turn-helix domain-containing protein [Solirubrobacterales bacterium]|nr:winged helix-turn-helix domain-containing protein [Solirubrobacterales bacterium]